jgi:hypothetical protein
MIELYDLNMDNTIILISKSTTKYKILRNTAIQSKYLYNIMQTDDFNGVIDLYFIPDQYLKKIIKFIKYITNKPVPIITLPIQCKRFELLICDIWFIDFFDVPSQELIDLIYFSNYLDIESLLYLSMCKMATIVLLSKNPSQYLKINKATTKYIQMFEESLKY